MIKKLFKKLKGLFTQNVPTEEEKHSKLLETEEEQEEVELQDIKEEDIELIKFNEHSLNYYRKHVKGNKNVSEEEANKKITRNMYLSLRYKRDNLTKKNPREWYAYGQLRFMVQNGEVKWIENNCVYFPMWYKDWNKYHELSKKLGIEKKHIEK